MGAKATTFRQAVERAQADARKKGRPMVVGSEVGEWKHYPQGSEKVEFLACFPRYTVFEDGLDPACFERGAVTTDLRLMGEIHNALCDYYSRWDRMGFDANRVAVQWLGDDRATLDEEGFVTVAGQRVTPDQMGTFLDWVREQEREWRRKHANKQRSSPR